MILYASFDAWVERDLLPGIESGVIAADNMIAEISVAGMTEHGTRHM